MLRPVANRESLPTMYDLPSEEIGDICYERQRAEQAIQHAEQEHQRAERLAEMLRQLGHDPDQL